MGALSADMSIITLDVNGLNMPIKRQDSATEETVYKKTYFKHNNIGRQKIKRQKKDTSHKNE